MPDMIPRNEQQPNFTGFSSPAMASPNREPVPLMAGYGQNQSPDALTTRLDRYGYSQPPNYGSGVSGWSNPDSQSNFPYANLGDPPSTMGSPQGILQMIMQHPGIAQFLAKSNMTPNRLR